MLNNEFAITSSGKDEWFTPRNAVLPIIKYLKSGSIIWCPFDEDDSEYVKVLKEYGYTVINTHINKGEDFFKIEVPECDYIISNPPYSLRNDILIRLFKIGKPFAMLMNTLGLFDNKNRWELFKNNNFSLIYLNKRIKYLDKDDPKKQTPPFQSAYICSRLSYQQIIFEEIDNK